RDRIGILDVELWAAQRRDRKPRPLGLVDQVTRHAAVLAGDKDAPRVSHGSLDLAGAIKLQWLAGKARPDAGSGPSHRMLVVAGDNAHRDFLHRELTLGSSTEPDIAPQPEQPDGTRRWPGTVSRTICRLGTAGRLSRPRTLFGRAAPGKQAKAAMKAAYAASIFWTSL